METNLVSNKLDLTELANKLFMYTDSRDWDKLRQEVFTEEVWFDMSSAGAGVPSNVSAKAICDMWQQGFSGIDAVHHQAGHYLITVDKDNANIYAYSIATHYKKLARNGNTRTFTGSYELGAVRTANGWRLNLFKYNLKFLDGNTRLD